MATTAHPSYTSARPSRSAAMSGPGPLPQAGSVPLAIPPYRRSGTSQNSQRQEGHRPDSPELLFDMSPEDGGLDAQNEDDRSFHTRIAAAKLDAPFQQAAVPSVPSSIFAHRNSPAMSMSTTGARSFQQHSARSYQYHHSTTPVSSQPAEPPLMYSFPNFRLAREAPPKPRYGALRPKTREPSPPFAPVRPDARRRRSSSTSDSSVTGSSKRASADTSAATSISTSPHDSDDERDSLMLPRACAVKRSERQKGSSETLSPAGLSAALRRTHLGSNSSPKPSVGSYGMGGIDPSVGHHRVRPTQQLSSRTSVNAEATSEWVKVSGTPPQSVRSRAAQELERLSRGRPRRT